MKFFRFAVVLVTLFVAVPATAEIIIVADDNFEDDIAIDNDVPSVTGNGPTNLGKPGQWIKNKFDQLSWFDNWPDELDADPDTNWQPRVTKDKVLLDGVNPKPGNELFYQNDHGATIHVAALSAATHEGECANYGLTEPGPCDIDKFARDAFLRFTDTAGNSRPAMQGELLRGSFSFTHFWGIPVFGLTNDIQQMVDDTANEDLHPPLSKWRVTFGQAFNPVDEGLEAWQAEPKGQHPHLVSLLAMTNGYNGRDFDVWVPVDENDLSKNQYRIDLNPDLGLAWPVVTGYVQRDTPECIAADCWRPGEFSDGIAPPFATLAYEYIVGDNHFKWMAIDKNDGKGFQEVTQAECSVRPGSLDTFVCENHELTDVGGLVPIGQSGLTAERGVEGLVFSDTGRFQTQYFIDDICYEIDTNPNPDAPGMAPTGCGKAPEPLQGDANGDAQVTGADLISVQQNFAMTGEPGTPGDANFDGLVTGADLIAVQQNFGKVAAAAVPEPAAAAIFVIVACAGFTHKTRGRNEQREKRMR